MVKDPAVGFMQAIRSQFLTLRGVNFARQTIKKGRNFMIKLGEKEVDYDPKFQLYLQTKLANP
eukprot:COSAG02_NODE_40185_length_408_cov_0.919094_1_plen_62_part_10